MSNVISMEKVRKRKNKTGKFVLLIICLVFILVIFAFQLINVNIITVIGNKIYSEEIIKNIVGIHEKTNLFVYKLASKELNLEEYPYIENIDIKYRSFNNIDIVVTEKSVISYIPYMGKYLCLSKDGTVIDYTNDLQVNIPIVHGLSFNHFVIGDKLFTDDTDIFKAILEISHKMKKFGFKIDYIDFNYNDPEQIILKIDKISISIGNINDINRKFELLKDLIGKLPEGVEGTINLTDADERNIIFTPYNSK
ncbi:FtsQ-type POTRA domain-containing protein [Vallitalea sp. AN17-2]|uniref:FtsQ-type POTRA domain-containing protein n=1 Tax=Vallitalea maricola TaxID=3074433 RepID=A0ACB5UQK7_9FIRM|nr:FtsQ-type POTRA domain-containing protein [Vallitalea sp. AN17-2]